MELKSNFKKWFWDNKVLLFVNAYTFILLIILIGLAAGKVVGYNWITGWLIGIIAFWLVLMMSIKSFSTIIKTNNHFLFYFLFLLKLGIYATPLFIAFLNNNSLFHFAGVLIGLSPLIFSPFVNSKIIVI